MTTLSLRAKPRWWDRESTLSCLTMLYDLLMFRELGYSIDAPRFNRHGDRKEVSFNIVFKSKANKTEFFDLGLTQYLMTELEKICRDRFVMNVDYHKKQDD